MYLFNQPSVSRFCSVLLKKAPRAGQHMYPISERTGGTKIYCSDRGWQLRGFCHRPGCCTLPLLVGIRLGKGVRGWWWHSSCTHTHTIKNRTSLPLRTLIPSTTRSYYQYIDKGTTNMVTTTHTSIVKFNSKNDNMLIIITWIDTSICILDLTKKWF